MLFSIHFFATGNGNFHAPIFCRCTVTALSTRNGRPLGCLTSARTGLCARIERTQRRHAAPVYSEKKALSVTQ
jgi:hypothetical protein